MTEQPSPTAQPADTEPPNPNFKALRFRVALMFGLIAAAFALVGSAILFIGDKDINLYDGFPEFDRTANNCNCDPNALAQSANQEDEPDTIGEHLSRMGDRIEQVLTEFIDSFSDRHVAGVSRFLAVIAIFLFTLITYRALLLDRFQNEARKDMITVFSHSGWHLIGVFFVPTIAAILSYILLTEGWILLADMFEDVKMTAIGAIFVTTVFVGTITFIVVSWTVAITTRDLLNFGLLTFVIGLSAGFAVADGAWWQAAVSEVGKDSQSDLLFAITLVSASIVFMLLWIDLDKLIRDIVGDKFKLIRALYLLASFSLALIGLFPRLGDDSGPYDATYILTFLAHTGGALIALIIFLFGGMVVFTIWMKRLGIFSRLFTGLSLAYVVFAVFEMIGFAIDQSNNPDEVSFINLTAVELIAFIGIGLWLYGALDNLLTRANSDHVEDNPYKDLPFQTAAKRITDWQRNLLKRLAALVDVGDNITMN
jgi:hypothetical protein